MKRSKKTYELALTSIIGAIIMFLSLVPNVGFITVLPGVAVTIVHIPVIIGVFLLGFKSSLILGLFFGLGSFFVALMRANTPFDLAFLNPLVSILPRILFAGIAYFIAAGFKKLSKVKLGKEIIFIIISLVSAVGLFFGVNQITRQYQYRHFTNEYVLVEEYKASIEKAKTDGKDQDTIDQMEDELVIKNENLAKTDEQAAINFKNAQKITIPISIVLIIGLTVLYYIFTVRKNNQTTYLPSVFILSTLVHTALVILAVIIIKPSLFEQSYPGQNFLLIIYSIAAINGIVEAFIAALIGTPITTAAINAQTEEE